MRIVGGDAGGITLKCPPGNITRPTSDRVRESVFNILFHRYGFEFERGADFFAGTGALGLEALSRGLKSCVFFEENRATLKCLEQNLQACRVSPAQYQVVSKPDLFHWRGLLKEKKAFLPLDLVFSDPPYHKKWTQKLAISVLDHPSSEAFIAPHCLWVCEIAEDDEIPRLALWEEDDVRDFGDTKVLFYRRRAGAPQLETKD